jgi:hypothetical protein
MDNQFSDKESYKYQVEYSKLGYVEVTIKSDHLSKNCLHYWPRGTFQLFGIPDAEKNELTGDMFMPMEGEHGFNQFTVDSFLQFIKERFPELDLTFHISTYPDGRIRAH